jgi:phosphoribosylaminoimidazole (AIR) synthetase
MDGHRAGLSAASDGHGGLDGLVVLVADDLEVLVLVAEDGVGPALDLQRRVGEGLARQLGLDLGKMVVVDVAVAAGPLFWIQSSGSGVKDSSTTFEVSSSTLLTLACHSVAFELKN